MKKEKSAENLEKQGRGLAIFLKILGVILLLLNLLLLDQEFVPWGETWEELKLNRPEDTVGMTDKELWAIAKDTLVEEEVVPFKSGFLCWGWVMNAWNEQKAKEAEREKQIREVREGAETVMVLVNEFLTENGIDSDSRIDPELLSPRLGLTLNAAHHEEFIEVWWNNFSSLDEEAFSFFKEKLKASFPDRDFSMVAVVCGNKCTAVAFSNEMTLPEEGTDYPYLDKNGHFDTERLWGFGFHTAVVGYVDEVMLEDEETSNQPNQE